MLSYTTIPINKVTKLEVNEIEISVIPVPCHTKGYLKIYNCNQGMCYIICKVRLCLLEILYLLGDVVDFLKEMENKCLKIVMLLLRSLW